MTEIAKIIEGCKHCISQSEYSYPCQGCPYLNEEECSKHLAEETVAALKRLQFLEKPTRKEQPMLPGIEFIDKSTGRVMSEREVYEYLKNNPEEASMFEKIAG